VGLTNLNVISKLSHAQSIYTALCYISVFSKKRTPLWKDDIAHLFGRDCIHSSFGRYLYMEVFCKVLIDIHRCFLESLDVKTHRPRRAKAPLA
jgi:hypothetical protein